MTRIVQAETPELVEQARNLFQDYAAALAVDLCFQGFEGELAGLPGEYAPPSGRLFLMQDEDRITGCVGLRKFSEGVAEMKRLYVVPAFRGRGWGRALAVAALRAASEIGYRSVRLDTLASMGPAIALYESLGFARTRPYRFNPIDGAVYMELVLRARGAPGP